MATGQRKSPSAVGFLTVLEHSQHGLMGGYLVLNIAGRPLEFHCTAPVKPNRAQQILYGPTLEPYLYGEQIGQALVSKSSLEPLVIFTDRPPALAVRTCDRRAVGSGASAKRYFDGVGERRASERKCRRIERAEISDRRAACRCERHSIHVVCDRTKSFGGVAGSRRGSHGDSRAARGFGRRIRSCRAVRPHSRSDRGSPARRTVTGFRANA